MLDNVFFSVISTRRPYSVREFEPLPVSDQLNWFVGEDEVESYVAAGGKGVYAGGGLCESRNLALETAFAEDKYCIQMSDDFKGAKIFTAEFSKPAPIDIEGAVKKMINVMETEDVYLAGVAPTDNPFYSGRNIKYHNFCVGDFIVVKPNPLRFDTNLKLKEDYDYTLQHIDKYGRVARCDFLLFSFLHRRNRGGAVDYRTDQLEQKTINYLMDKWPKHLRLNPRRQNEIILSWKD